MREAARKHALTAAGFQDWKDRFLLGAENALPAHPKDEQALHKEQVKGLKEKIGDMVLDLDIAKEVLKRSSFAPSKSDD